jgi:NitT/TauT family transport system ATP-binding protein
VSEVAVSARGISHTFFTVEGAVQALENVDIEVTTGSTACIVGPSGCGKSTLLRILIGLLSPLEGKVILNDRLCSEGVAYIQQTPHLLPWRTVLQNAALGLEIQQNVTKATIQRTRDDLNKFGLSNFESSLVGHLSGGMKQKVALTGALTCRPKLLFCDEPFSAIDFVGRLALLGIFKFMCSVHGITTIFVTHNIEEAIFLGDSVYVLSRHPGRVLKNFNTVLKEKNYDPVECRDTPEFSALFRAIWSTLNEGQ